MEAVIASVFFAIGLLKELTVQIESYRLRGDQIPKDMHNQCRRIARICPVLSGSLRCYASLLAELCEPGRLPADLLTCTDSTAPDDKRVAAMERMLPLFMDRFPWWLRRGSRNDFFRTLWEGAPHLSSSEVLKRRIMSCLVVVAREIRDSVTLGEFIAIGKGIMLRKMDGALQEDVLGTWYRTAAGPVEELSPDYQDNATLPETIADLKSLRSTPGLTPKEQAVIDTAVRIRSAVPSEIAVALGISAGAVRVHLCNARRVLRQIGA